MIIQQLSLLALFFFWTRKHDFTAGSNLYLSPCKLTAAEDDLYGSQELCHPKIYDFIPAAKRRHKTCQLLCNNQKQKKALYVIAVNILVGNFKAKA